MLAIFVILESGGRLGMEKGLKDVFRPGRETYNRLVVEILPRERNQTQGGFFSWELPLEPRQSSLQSRELARTRSSLIRSSYHLFRSTPGGPLLVEV